MRQRETIFETKRDNTRQNETERDNIRQRETVCDKVSVISSRTSWRLSGKTLPSFSRQAPYPLRGAQSAAFGLLSRSLPLFRGMTKDKRTMAQEEKET